jgi:hypothetical protein
MSAPLASLILMCPARVHSSISELKSSLPAFSLDHMLMAPYGKEYISTFFPVMPWASRTISRLLVKTAESRTVLNAAIGFSPSTSSGPTPHVVVRGSVIERRSSVHVWWSAVAHQRKAEPCRRWRPPEVRQRPAEQGTDCSASVKMAQAGVERRACDATTVAYPGRAGDGMAGST